MEHISKGIYRKLVETNLGELNCYELLDTLRQVEQMRAEIKKQNPKAHLNIIKAPAGNYVLQMHNTLVA